MKHLLIIFSLLLTFVIYCDQPQLNKTSLHNTIENYKWKKRILLLISKEESNVLTNAADKFFINQKHPIFLIILIFNFLFQLIVYKFNYLEFDIGFIQLAINCINFAILFFLSNIYDLKIFKDFGFTIIDECHHIGAETFSKSLFKINSYYMLGLSATPKRKDGLSKVFELFLGDYVYKETEKKFIEDVFSIDKSITIIFISHKMTSLSMCNKIFDLKLNKFN